MLARPKPGLCPPKAARHEPDAAGRMGHDDIEQCVIRLFEQEKKIRQMVEAGGAGHRNANAKENRRHANPRGKWLARGRTLALCLVVGWLAYVAWSWPWLFPVLFVATCIILVTTFFALGPDRVSDLVVGAYHWLDKRDSSRAEALRLTAKSLSRRIERWAGYLPERWTGGLYLPDFEPDGIDTSKLRNDPFERIAQEAQKG